MGTRHLTSHNTNCLLNVSSKQFDVLCSKFLHYVRPHEIARCSGALGTPPRDCTVYRRTMYAPTRLHGVPAL